MTPQSGFFVREAWSRWPRWGGLLATILWTGSGFAEPTPTPAMSMEKAAQLTQAAMEARGLAKDHFVRTIQLADDNNFAVIEALGGNKSPELVASLVLYIHPDGSVAWKEGSAFPPRLDRREAPTISIEKAAQIAQHELEARGVAKDHSVRMLGFAPVAPIGDGRASYVVRIASTGPDAADGSKYLEMKVNMDGSVTSFFFHARAGFGAPPRIRVVPALGALAPGNDKRPARVRVVPAAPAPAIP